MSWQKEIHSHSSVYNGKFELSILCIKYLDIPLMRWKKYLVKLCDIGVCDEKSDFKVMFYRQTIQHID